MGFSRFYKSHRNKIWAVSLSALAFALFLGYYVTMEVLSGWVFFRSDFLQIWNFLLYLLVYSIILFANIRNDNVAYMGILMFVFFTFFSRIWDLFPASNNLLASFSSGSPTLITLCAGFLVTALGQFVLGIMLYFRIHVYSRGRDDNYMRIRVLGICYGVALALCLSFRIALLILLQGAFGPAYTFLVFMIPLSEVVMSGAIVFTLERLRRL